MRYVFNQETNESCSSRILFTQVTTRVPCSAQARGEETASFPLLREPVQPRGRKGVKGRRTSEQREIWTHHLWDPILHFSFSLPTATISELVYTIKAEEPLMVFELVRAQVDQRPGAGREGSTTPGEWEVAEGRTQGSLISRVWMTPCKYLLTCLEENGKE